ncbi:hypothetical protein C2845_PM15G02370 [Panicum miliaceum]|uniref:Uncharacterized protein n=1 Tax=Panicum miliaceum TaxID=4540 RepID=A0A3L6Q8N3_PANMI|nr:hypothetical protein C2845_PM15G02370 [Panicum miliaceum]
MALVNGQPEVVVMALVIGQPESVVIAGEVVITLVVVVVMAGPVQYAPLVVVLMMGPVELTESEEYAQMLPPLIVVVAARYDPEQQKVVHQAVQYLVYATEWYCQRIVQGNSSHLQWACLSHYPHSLISGVAPLVRMHIGVGSVFPQTNPHLEKPETWQLPLSSQLCRLDTETSR